VTGDRRKLHNEELQNLYSTSHIIRMIEPWRMRWAGHVPRMGRRGMHIAEGNRPLGRPSVRWVDNIEID
jgi:hypothetical protein